MTVAVAIGRYWQEAGQYQKGGDVLRHLTWLQDRLGKATLLRSVTSREVAALVAQRRADGVSNATVNRSVVDPLRRVINRAQGIWGEVVSTIRWRDLRLREADRREREASRDEEAMVLAAAREEYRAPIRFAILSGFRRSEVANLRWRDIDWHGRLIHVVGKGDKKASIPLTPAIEDVLRPLRGHHFDYVFTYIRQARRAGHPEVGTRVPITSQGFYVAFTAACRASGVENLRPHDLRHTAGSRITRTGGLRVAKEALRHSSITSTMRYAHVRADEVGAAMQAAASQTASLDRISDAVEDGKASNGKGLKQ